jgi:hypothetical protein
MNAPDEQQTAKTKPILWRKRWVAAGCGIISVAMFVLLLGDNSPDFWVMSFPFTALTTALSLLFVLPAYVVYLAVVMAIFSRRTLSVTARRHWFLGLPTVLLIGVILISANQARPTVAIRWVTRGKSYKSIRSVRTARASTMMSDRRVAWFQIGSGELKDLIAQHQLTPTNGISLNGILCSDLIMGQSTIAERIPSFRDPIYYARFGSDDDQHPYRVIVLTHPGHDAAVWYSTYDR